MTPDAAARARSGGEPWPFGLHQVEDVTLFVSRGIGATEVLVRTFTPPDVAVFTPGQYRDNGRAP